MPLTHALALATHQRFALQLARSSVWCENQMDDDFHHQMEGEALPSRKRGVGRRRCVVGAALLLLLAAQTRASDAAWHYPDAPLRAHFQVAAGEELALIDFPWQETLAIAPSRFAARHQAGERQVRVVAVSSNSATLLVDCRSLAAESPVTLYAITNQTPLQADTTLADPQPVGVTIRRAGAHEAPPTWEQLRFMASRPQPVAAFKLEGLIPVSSGDEAPRKWYQPSWRRPVYVACLSGRLLVPQSGSYRLALKGPEPLYLVIDGKLVLEHATPRRGGADEWLATAPLELPAGLLRYEVYTLATRYIRLQAGWQGPGESQIVPLPATALISAHEPRPLCFEERDAAFPLGIDYHLEPSYTLHERHTLFTPLTLRALYRSSAAEEPVARWYHAQQLLGTGLVCRVVVTNSGPCRVELTLTDSDGQSRRTQRELRLPDLATHEYRLAAQLAGLPPYGYEDDPAQPEVHLRGTLPAALPLTVSATLTAPDGQQQTWQAEVHLQRGWGRLALPPTTLHQLAALQWEVRHAAVTVAAGSLRVQRSPFSELPTAASGTLLTIDDQPTLLIAPQASRGHPAAMAPLPPGAQLLLLDGFLTTLPHRNGVNGADFDRELMATLALYHAKRRELAANPIRYRRQRLQAPAASGLPTPGPLVTLARLDTLRPADVVVVAPDIVAPAAGETLAQFERRLATLVALLQEALPATVVLLTPPPGLVLDESTGASASAREIRPYAEVVQRVADALGTTVADLYTICQTHPEPPPVAEGRLTAAGQRLAAEVVARAVAGWQTQSN